jgi:SPP1 family predicted phage head-tail adaptor
MASYNRPILIQKLDEDTEKWSDYYLTHANVNKASGKEYFNASTNISNSTYNFKVRYCEKLKELLFNTEIYRVVYESRCYDIENVDRYAENKTELTIIGDYNGKAYTS